MTHGAPLSFRPSDAGGERNELLRSPRGSSRLPLSAELLPLSRPAVLRIVAGDPTALDQLADLTAVPVDELTWRNLRREGGIYSYHGEIAPQPMMRRSRMYVCPRCVIEDVAASHFPPIAACYGRTAWQFEPIRACDRHGILLHQIGRPLHRSIAHDFARTIWPLLHTLERFADEAAAVPPSAAEAYLKARLDGSARPSPLLDQMPWYAAARTCEAVGAVALFRASVTLAGLKVGESATSRPRRLQDPRCRQAFGRESARRSAPWSQIFGDRREGAPPCTGS